MSDTVKLIVEFPKDLVLKGFENRFTEDEKDILIRAIGNGTSLNDVKAEIEKLNPVDYGSIFSYESHNGAKDMQRDILEILDNIEESKE